MAKGLGMQFQQRSIGKMAEGVRDTSFEVRADPQGLVRQSRGVSGDVSSVALVVGVFNFDMVRDGRDHPRIALSVSVARLGTVHSSKFVLLWDRRLVQDILCTALLSDGKSKKKHHKKRS